MKYTVQETVLEYMIGCLGFIALMLFLLCVAGISLIMLLIVGILLLP